MKKAGPCGTGLGRESLEGDYLTETGTVISPEP
jgi:hypothetical protein